MAQGCYWERYLQTLTGCKLQHVIARSEATRQSASPQKCITKSSISGEMVSGADLPRVLLIVWCYCKENGLPRRGAAAPLLAMTSINLTGLRTGPHGRNVPRFC